MSNSPTIDHVASKDEESKTKTIHADELRAGYEVIDVGVVERIRGLPFAHLVMVLYEGDVVYRPYARNHEFEVALSDLDF